ncbi:MAG: peptidylprolyl isomerase [Ezakiella sp.]|nr:peptidylprolyl isomerase [Ezakiella sp.]MDD7471920.1 peptidylprolyl isomerase [Bacillota bacterium]MDY3923884.1 peptidylprolyl isomerase [Ezakiella sp.]
MNNLNKDDLKVIAKVGDREVTNGDFAKFLQTLDPSILRHFMNEPDGFKTVLEEMLNQELLLNYAKAHNFQDEEEFKKVLNNTIDGLLKSYSYQKVINKAKEPTEEEIDLFMENHADEFDKPFVNASHILVDNEEIAKKVMSEMDTKTFEELAKEYSTCPSKDNGGNLGDFTKGQMVKEFEDAVFSMKEGEVRGPIKTQFGFHIIRLNKINSVQKPDDETMRKEVRLELLRRNQLAHYQEFISKLKEKNKVEIFI